MTQGRDQSATDWCDGKREVGERQKNWRQKTEDEEEGED